MVSSTLRILLTCAIFLYFIIVFVLLKNKALTLKYTLLWILSGLCMGLLVIFPAALREITELIGIANEMNGLFAISLSFIICLVMALTSIVSRQTAKIRRLIQTVAMLEKRIRDIEKPLNSIKDGEDG